MTISKLVPKLTSQLFTRAILALILSFGLWGTSIASCLASHTNIQSDSRPSNSSFINHNPRKAPKTLVLIIASDKELIYRELQKVWRVYMHSDPEHFEAYFIKSDPKLPVKYKLDGDTIWSRSVENIIPGVLNKTILSLEYLSARIQAGEFDYILRTNLSSFYIYPGLLDYLKSCPTTKFYGGSDAHSGKFGAIMADGSGSGFLFSPDLAQLLINNSATLINHTWPDDIAIAQFFRRHKILLQPHPRVNIYTSQDWKIHQHKLTQANFQIRVNHKNSKSRIKKDLPIYAQLLEKFYGKTL